MLENSRVQGIKAAACIAFRKFRPEFDLCTPFQALTHCTKSVYCRISQYTQPRMR